LGHLRLTSEHLTHQVEHIASEIVLKFDLNGIRLVELDLGPIGRSFLDFDQGVCLVDFELWHTDEILPSF
jgi:hypothetical protein